MIDFTLSLKKVHKTCKISTYFAYNQNKSSFLISWIILLLVHSIDIFLSHFMPEMLKYLFVLKNRFSILWFDKLFFLFVDRYLKSVFPTVEEYLLLDVLSNSDNNVQKGSDRLVKMGYVKRDTPSKYKVICYIKRVNFSLRNEHFEITIFLFNETVKSYT